MFSVSLSLCQSIVLLSIVLLCLFRYGVLFLVVAFLSCCQSFLLFCCCCCCSCFLFISLLSFVPAHCLTVLLSIVFLCLFRYWVLFPLIALLSYCQSCFCVYFVTGFCSHSLPCCPAVNRTSVFISLLGFVPTHCLIVLLSIILLCLFRYWVLFPLIALLSCCQSFSCLFRCWVLFPLIALLSCCQSFFYVYFVTGFCSCQGPFFEEPELIKRSLFEVWDRSDYSFLCFIFCEVRNRKGPLLQYQVFSRKRTNDLCKRLPWF